MKFYGGLKPTNVIGKKQFASHDATSSWSDNGVAVELAADAIREIDEMISGAVTKIQKRFSEDLAAYGAHQVRDAVVDYVANGYLDIAVVDGKLCACFDASNEQAKMVAVWDLALLLRRAANEALTGQDAETYQAIANLVEALPTRQPPPPPMNNFEANEDDAPIGRRSRPSGRASRPIRSMV